MPYVYMLRDEAGRHYIGATANLTARLNQHRNGGTQTTRRMVGELKLVGSRSYKTLREALVVERKLKSWKNPAKAQAFLTG